MPRAARRVHPAAVAAAAAALDGSVRQAAHAMHALALEDARSPASCAIRPPRPATDTSHGSAAFPGCDGILEASGATAP